MQLDIRDKLIRRLKEAGGYVSGEVLSEELGITRTAIWKHIRELRSEGYEIESSPGLGYRLAGVPRKMNARELAYDLGTTVIGKDIRYFESIDSTNSAAKKAAAEGCDEGTVIVADAQTAGRGRLGRSWNSAAGKGIWMSVVLRPEMAPEDVQLVTIAASVAVSRAIFSVTGIRTGIKWPNDIILDGKKVCGILTEMSTEIDRINYVVLGIGLNVSHGPADFPEEIRDKATSLMCHQGEGLNDADEKSARVRTALFREILRELENVYFMLGSNAKAVLDEWREWSVTLGRPLRAEIRGVEYKGTAVDITPEGRLVIKCSDGVIREVMSGEVSIRGVMGYV